MIDNKPKQPWLQPALAMFARLSGWILAPLIIGLIIGKWLDRRYGTAPWLFLSATLAAFIISMIGLVKNAAEEFKKIDGAGKAPGREHESSERNNDK